MVSSELWLNILKASPVPTAVFRVDNRYSLILANTAYTNLFGIQDADILNKSVFEIFLSDDIQVKGDFIPGVVQSLQKVFESGSPDRICNAELSIHSRDSSVTERLCIDLENTPVKEDGVVKYICQSVLQYQDPGLPFRPTGAAETLRTKINQEALINSSDDLIWSVDTDFKIITANRAFLSSLKNATGRDLQEGDSVLDDVFSDDIRTTWKGYYDRTLRGDHFTVKEEVFNSLKNRIDYSVVSFSPMRNEQGEIFGAACYSKDITNDTLVMIDLQQARNEADKILESSEKNEKRYRSLVENGADVVVILDPAGKPMYVSSSITRVLGYTEDEAMSFALNDLIHPSDWDAAAEGMYESLQNPGKTINGHISRVRHKDGSWRWLEASLTNMIRDPMINGIVNNFRDVTGKKQAELEKNLLINNTEESFVLVNRDLEIVSFNDQFEKLYKTHFNKVVEKGQSILIYTQPERRSIVSGIYSRVFRGETETSEINVADPLSNEKKIFSIKFKPAKNSQDEIIGAFVTAADITHRQLALEKLTESEKRYKLLFQSSPLPNFVYDLGDFQILDVNDTATSHYGYTRAEFLSRTILDITAPYERQRLGEIHEQIQISERVVNFGIFVHLKKDGGLIQSDVSGYKINFGGRECMMTSCNDVTERENAYQRLKENESKLLASQKIAKVGYWQSFANNKGLYWSDEVYNIWGVNKQTFNLDYDAHFNTIHPDDREKFLKSRDRTFKEGVQHNIEHRIILPDGTIKWVHALGNLIKNDQGKIIIFEGTVQDITADKLAQEALEVSNARYEYVTRATSDAIWDWDLKKDEIYRGGGFQTLFGCPAETTENLHTFWQDHIHPDDIKGLLKNIAVLMAEKPETWTLEYRFKKSNGKYAFVEDKGILVMDKNGTPIRMIGAMQDVSDSKISERQKLLHAETSRIFNQPDVLLNDILGSVLQHVLNYGDTAIAEIWLSSPDQKRINLSAKCTKGSQFDPFYNDYSEYKSLASGEGLPWKVWRSREVELWENIESDSRFLRREAAGNAALKTAIGLPLIYNDEFIGVLVLGLQENGEHLWDHVSFRDDFCQHLSSEIKRKQLDQELKQIFSFAPDVISVSGTDGFLKKINPAACAMLEYTEEELLSAPITDFVHPDDKDRTRQNAENLAKGTDTLYFENRYVTKSGKVIWLGWTSTPSPEEGLIFAVAKDITEKKNLEVLLEKSNSLAEIGSWEINMQSNSLYWSPVTKQIHEMDADYEPDVETAINFYKEGFNRDSIRRAFELSLNNGTDWDMELQIVTGKGNEVWVRTIGEAEYVNGKCVKLYGSFQNITHRKVAEIELLKIYEERNTILESIGDGFFAVDKNWTVNYWNKEAEKLLGKSKNQTLGNHLWKVFANMTGSPSYSKYQEAIDTNHVVRFEDYYPAMHKWYEISAYPSIDGLSVFFRDITDRIKHIDAIEKQNRRFNEISWIQSHVVRAPIARLMGLIDLIKHPASSEQLQSELLNYILESAHELDNIVREITIKAEEIDLNKNSN